MRKDPQLKAERDEVGAVLKRGEKDKLSLSALTKYSAFPPEIYGLLIRAAQKSKRGKK